MIALRPASAVLPTSLQNTLNKFKIPESSLSAVVYSLDDHKTLLAHRAKTPRNPASVMKLLTTFAALDILGPAHSWQTRYFANGPIQGGVLEGDLIIKGEGDPYLVQEQFWLQLAALREMGIETVRGDLLIDNSAFDLPAYDRGAFDQKPTRLYNVGPSATVLNFNATRFRLRPVAGKIAVTIDPPMHNIVISNRLKATKGKCHGAQYGWSIDVRQQKEQVQVIFNGSYRSACGSHDLRRVVLDADAYLYGAFVAYWKNLGGKFDGAYGYTRVEEEAEPLYVANSRPLSEVIIGTNKYSNNLLARQLLLSIAFQEAGIGATTEEGVDAIKSWLQDNQLIMPELVIENGSGLSREIRISAESLNSLLQHAAESPYQPEFLASFSLGGMDGTMKKRLNGLVSGGHVRLKTGYIKGVRTLAGYLRADSGADYAVVLLISNSKVNFSNGNAIQDEFVKWVLRAG